MLRSLARVNFLDRTLTSTALDDLASFWSRVCCLAEGFQFEHWKPEYALELRLSGFPRAAGPGLLDVLTRRYSAPGIVVTLTDPDTLVVAWQAEGRREPPSGLGLRVVAGKAFEGVVVEIRLAVSGRARLTSTTAAGWTLVVAGEVREEALFAKAVWGGRARASEFGLQKMPTPWEYELLAGFDEFCKTGVVHPRFAHAAYFPLPRNSEAGLHAWMTTVPFGRPRLGGLLGRVAALVAALVAFITALYFGGRNGFVIFLVIVSFTFWLSLFIPFFQNEWSLLFDSFEPQAARAAYRRAERYTALTPEQAASRLDDPAVRKYTADALAAGFVHAGDVSPVPFESAVVIYRIFHAPDGVTSLALICNTRGTDGRDFWPIWPATIGFECQTFFSDGGRVDSLAEATHPTGVTDWPASTRLLAFPTATDPLALYQAHREVADDVLGEMAVTRVRHELFDAYLRRQEQISEAEHRANAARPYSWRDHIRWYLQLDAKPSGDSK